LVIRDAVCSAFKSHRCAPPAATTTAPTVSDFGAAAVPGEHVDYRLAAPDRAAHPVAARPPDPAG
jgi:hypothetical protein